METNTGNGGKSVRRRNNYNIKRNHNVSPSTGVGNDNSGDEQDALPRLSDKQRQISRGSELATRAKRPDLSGPFQPLFFFGGKNGEELIESILTNMGWKRTADKTASNTKLLWTECKSLINFAEFRECEQLVNHIPNCELLTNKLGLLMSLREFERIAITIKNKPPRLRLADFHPETYVLDDATELELFYQTFQPGEIWICKPTGLNQGIGIYLVRDLESFKKQWTAKLQSENASKLKTSVRKAFRKRDDDRIIQRYIMQPLLIDDRKFDIRCYVLVASTVPYVVLFHNGYLRLSIHKYNTELADLTVHLTNQYIQKKDPAYETVKNDTVWNMDKFNDYINSSVASQHNLCHDWVWNVLTPRIKEIAGHVFNSVRGKFAAKVGFFELFGLDFMIDKDFKIWLIEINTNPSLTTNCDVLERVIPSTVAEGVDLVLECFEKSRRGLQISPLQSLKTWEVLYQESSNRQRSKSMSNSTNSSSRSSTNTSLFAGIRYSPPLGLKSENRSPSGSLSSSRRVPITTSRVNLTISDAQVMKFRLAAPSLPITNSHRRLFVIPRSPQLDAADDFLNEQYSKALSQADVVDSRDFH